MVDLQELDDFISKYNKYGGRSSTGNFLYFYSEILGCLINEQGLIDDSLEIIEKFIMRIRIIDDLIDNDKLPIEIAFPSVFPEILSLVEVCGYQLERCKRKLLSEASTTSIMLKEQSDNALHKYQRGKVLDSDLLKRGIAAIYTYALREISVSKNGIHGTYELEQLLSEYNCDFYLYNSIVFNSILKNRFDDRDSLLDFLQHYFIIDGILDSFCDLFDDIEKGSFNFLLAMSNNNYSNNIRKALFFSGVYDLFFQIAEKHYISGQESLAYIKNDKLGQRLKGFLDGAWFGISIAKQNCFFADSDPSSINLIEQLLYKPHPWEIVDGSMVLKHVAGMMTSIEREIKILKKKTSKGIWPHQEWDGLEAVEKYYQSIKDKSIDKDIIILRTNGCQKAFTDRNKCNHCGIYKSYYTSAAFRQETLQAFKGDFSMIDTNKVNQLGIYCLGSFFNDDEVDEGTRQRVYEMINSESRKIRFVFESLPKFITDRTIRHMRTFLPSHEIAVGFGFDAKSDFVRNVILNKSISLEHAESAIKVLKKYDIYSIGYVSLKPPFLTEWESIFEAIYTGRYLQGMGVDYVSIEPIAVQENTVQALLGNRGLYHVPWLWSCIEVGKILCKTGKVLFGGQAFLPIPTQTAKNCGICTERILQKMRLFNIEQDVSIFYNEECNCKSNYVRIIEEEKSFLSLYSDDNRVPAIYNTRAAHAIK